jgi:hypothetical protein
MIDQAYIERVTKRRAICARLMALVLLLTGLHDIGALHGTPILAASVLRPARCGW